jgi:hypothetical protein
MRKLIFIDNDNLKSANEDSDYAKSNIQLYFNLPVDIIDGMQIVPDFRDLSREDMFILLFDPKNVICTWSMYTTTHYNSLGQLIYLLAGAGRNDIKDIIYIDGSGQLMDVLDRAIVNNPTHAYDIIQAIETNNIISFDSDTRKGGRIRMVFNGRREKCFKLEEIDLFDLFIREKDKQKGDIVFTHDLSDVEVGDRLYNRYAESFIVDEIEKDCSARIFKSNGKPIGTEYGSIHNMRTKSPFLAKIIK